MLKLAVGLLALSSAFAATVSSSRSVSVNADGSARATTIFDGLVNSVVKLQQGTLSSSNGVTTATGESLLYWISGFNFPRAFVQYREGTVNVNASGMQIDADITKGVAFTAVFPAVISYEGNLTVSRLSTPILSQLNLDFVLLTGPTSVDVTLPTQANEPIKITLDRAGINLEFSIANQTITSPDNVKYYPNQAKLDIELDLTALSSLDLTAGRKIALMGRLFAVGVTDSSAQVDAAIKSGTSVNLKNDLSFSPADSSDFEGFFNWERTVTVTLNDGSTQDVSVSALVVQDNAITGILKTQLDLLDIAIGGELSGFATSRTVFWTFEVADVSKVSSIYWDPEMGADVASASTSGTSASYLSALSFVALIMTTLFVFM